FAAQLQVASCVRAAFRPRDDVVELQPFPRTTVNALATVTAPDLMSYAFGNRLSMTRLPNHRRRFLLNPNLGSPVLQLFLEVHCEVLVDTRQDRGRADVLSPPEHMLHVEINGRVLVEVGEAASDLGDSFIRH